jgi:hypothetical protein
MPKIALNQEQWKRVEEVYHEALEHRPESRAAFVTAAATHRCGAKWNRCSPRTGPTWW